MKRIYGILAVGAVMAAFAGCQDANNSAMRSNNGTNNSAMNQDANGQPTNPDLQKPGQVYAVHESRGSDKNSHAITTDDRVFLVNAECGGEYEVEASQLALQKSTDSRVRMIAQHMVDDHSKANDALRTLAASKNVMVGTAPSIEQKQMIDKLNGLSGTDFDREYLSQQKTAHEETIASFQTAATNASDPEIRDWANQMLPTLKDHLHMIENDQNNTVGMQQ